jgi:SPW repeat
MSTHSRTRRPRANARSRRGGPPRIEPQSLGGPPVQQPLEASAPRDWRAAVTMLSGLNVLAGAWLIIAPWVLGYSAGDPKWNDVVFGAIVVVLAGARSLGAFRATLLSVINAVVGVWLVIAAFTIDASATASWNDVILGVIVFVLGVASAFASGDAAQERAS